MYHFKTQNKYFAHKTEYNGIEYHSKKEADKIIINNDKFKPFGNVKRGTYDINGKKIFFRSKWEANYALYLDFLIKQKEIKKWEYEPKKFIFEQIQSGTRSYTPDFKIIKNNNNIEWHEVKGHMTASGKTKIKRFKKYYPEEKLILIEEEEYNAIKKWSKLLNWY